MTPRPRVIVSILVLWAGLEPSEALAREHGCRATAIEADAALRGRFPGLIEATEAALLPRSDVDACAHVELGVQEGAITISVTLADGRSASRSVTRAEDVLPTVQALLLVPGSDSPAATAVPVAVTPASAAPPNGTPHEDEALLPRSRSLLTVSQGEYRAEPRDDGPAQPGSEERELGVELSILTGARVGDGQSAFGAGVLSFLELRGWLIGFGGRIDSYRPVLGGDSDTAVELALLAGRRFALGDLALDVTAGPAVAMKGIGWTESDVRVVEATRASSERPLAPPQAAPLTAPVPRLLVAARLGFSARSVLRTFVGIDGALGPSRPRGAPEVSGGFSGRMPVYTVGVALGATVGTP